jgi:hypothetical protein
MKMRFMVMVKATKDSEAGKLPSEELLAAMAKFNEEMAKAGVMLDGNGLQPSSKGARVRFSGDKRTVIDGPFAETKELSPVTGSCNASRLRRRSNGSGAAPIHIRRMARSRSGKCSSWRTLVRAKRSSITAAWPNRSQRSSPRCSYGLPG